MTLLTTAFAQGTHAGRPAASSSNNGFYYYETDTQILFQSTGSAWQQLAPSIAGGVTSANNEVTADQTTSSVSYTDLATTGPTFSITVGGDGLLLVGWNCQFDGTTNGAQMSIALSGANTVAASDQWALYCGGLTNGFAYGRTYVFTGLSAGSTTVTAKYKSPSGSSVGFQRRSVWAMDL